MANKVVRKIVKNQILRFMLSAGMGFLVDITVFYLLYHNLLSEKRYHFFNSEYKNSTVSLAISYCLGVMVNFLITKYLVFSESTTSSTKQFVRFASVAVIGFFANLGAIDLLIHYFNMYPPLARPLAMLSLFFASFFIHKFFSFSLSMRHQHEAAPTK
ncbi:MAG: GtrA family protein [Mucilaginibacter sp.]